MSQKIMWIALEECHLRLTFTCMYFGMCMCIHAHVNMQTHKINDEEEKLAKKEESWVFDTHRMVSTFTDSFESKNMADRIRKK